LKFARDGFSVEAAIAKGRPLPSWYMDEEPEIEPADSFFLRAFGDLSTCRSSGMDLGPIPWTAIVNYGERAGLEPDTIEAFVIVIRTMDGAYRKWHDAEQEKKRGAGK